MFRLLTPVTTLPQTSPASVGLSFDEKTNAHHVLDLLAVFGAKTTLAQVRARHRRVLACSQSPTPPTLRFSQRMIMCAS